MFHKAALWSLNSSVMGECHGMFVFKDRGKEGDGGSSWKEGLMVLSLGT